MTEPPDTGKGVRPIEPGDGGVGRISQGGDMYLPRTERRIAGINHAAGLSARDIAGRNASKVG
ncbi:MAG: hypothetical protein M3O31_10825 [Acidobacteriota bacterium]|nr:hypothetical protein [Acidobacteriota bacterium]